ncbi:MAG TPA: hypothetical protein VNP04_06770, partial [Alphaproteobacteria bacterium]|nr:hypothetical protein [Alphaproteobacteria bacterium]
LAKERLVRVVAEGHAYKVRRLLWFLSHSHFTLNEVARDALISGFNHPDPAVRTCAFRLAVGCHDRVALSAHVASEWRARTDDTTFESCYGSHALIAGADPLDYGALRGRVAPELLGHLALQDGPPGAIDAFAEDLDALWTTMTQSPGLPTGMNGPAIVHSRAIDPAMPEGERGSIAPWAEAALHTIHVFGHGPRANVLQALLAQFPPDASMREQHAFREGATAVIREVRETARHVISQRMPERALAEVIARHRQRVEKWLAFLACCDTVPWDMVEFYCQLCLAVGKAEPDRAADIIARLRQASVAWRSTYSRWKWKVDRLTWIAFQLPSSPKVDEVREHILEAANTDELLLQIALAAQANRATDWLTQVIQRDLAAPEVCRVARALTLIGFLDEGALLDECRHALDGRTGFLGDVAHAARGRLERNRQARAWFDQFRKRRNPVEAWAAFRLFLRCVDRRFYLWSDVLCQSTPDLPGLWQQQMSMNADDIYRSTEKNEGELAKSLFGQRISRNELAPWYPTPPMAAAP